MEIKTSAFIFILLYTVNCKPSDSSDIDMDGDYEMQNDNNNYGTEYDDPEDPEESKAVVDEKPLKINTDGKDFTRNLGESVILPCSISGSNYVRVWRKKDAEKKDPVLFQASVGMAAAPNMKHLEDGSLKISNLHIQNAGEYECTAMGSAKNSPKVKHKVILRVPPEIKLLTSKDNITTLRSGETLILTCKANGYPMPNISWHKDSYRFNAQGDFLEITNVNHRDAGTYKCLADNKIGEPAFGYINIKVEYKPVINVERIIVSSENNSETVLECLVHAEPRAAVFWSKDGLNIKNTERTQLVSNEHKHNLILKDLRDSDFGEYTCSARNAVGGSEKIIRLIKTPAVVHFKPKTDVKEITLVWEVQSKSNLSANELSYRRKGEDKWIPLQPEITLVGRDIYEVKHVFNKGLDPGEYETKLRSKNYNGWSEYSDEKSFNIVTSKHGHHKPHKKGHKQEKEKQITPTTPTSAEHQANENQTGFIKESPATGTNTSDSASLSPTMSLFSISLIVILQIRLESIRT